MNSPASSRFLSSSQIPTGQGLALRAAEQANRGTVGSTVRTMVARGEVPVLTEFQRASRRIEIAQAMVQGCIEAHVDTLTAEPMPRTDPLAEFRALMYYAVGHPDRWQRYDTQPPITTLTGTPGRGNATVFSHAVAALVDWPHAEVVLVAKTPDFCDELPQNWLIMRHNLLSGHSQRETITQVEKGSGSDITLYASPVGNDPRLLSTKTPRYYSPELTSDYRATAMVVSERCGQLGRGSLCTELLTDDVGTMCTALQDMLARYCLPAALLTEEVSITLAGYEHAAKTASNTFALAS